MTNFFLSLLNILTKDMLNAIISRSKLKSKYFYNFRNNKTANLSGMVL